VLLLDALIKNSLFFILPEGEFYLVVLHVTTYNVMLQAFHQLLVAVINTLLRARSIIVNSTSFKSIFFLFSDIIFVSHFKILITNYINKF